MIANFNMSDLYDFFVVTDSLIFPNGREMKKWPYVYPHSQ